MSVLILSAIPKHDSAEAMSVSSQKRKTTERDANVCGALRLNYTIDESTVLSAPIAR